MDIQRIIIINGPAGSGKDTFVTYCRQIAEELGFTLSNISSVDGVKEYLKTHPNADGKLRDGVTKDEYRRQQMINLKQQRISENPLKITSWILEQMKTQNADLNFIHIREPDEIEKLKNLGTQYGYAVSTLHVSRDEVQTYANGVDDQTQNYGYDHWIKNNKDLETLKDQAGKYMRRLINS